MSTSGNLNPVEILLVEDILRAYEANANCYVKKPMDFDPFVRVVQSVHQFWLTIVTLPPQTEQNRVGDTS